MPALDGLSLRSNLKTCFRRTFGGVHCFHTSLIVATCSQKPAKKTTSQLRSKLRSMREKTILGGTQFVS